MPGYLCVGEYSSIPYRIQGLEMHVYCMEELCYCLKENAFLVDSSIMNDNLIKWIRQQCGLDELADYLYPMVHRQGALSVFVSAILQYVGLYEPAQIRQVEQILKKGAGMSGLEKRKEQIDYLVMKKKFVAALRGYENLLLKWEEHQNAGKERFTDELLAEIWHNKGVAYARLMLYQRAGESFLKAYRITKNEEEYQCYLATKRLELPEKKYVSFVAGEMEHYQTTLELEKRMEELRQDFGLQPEALMLRQRLAMREGTERQKYYEESESLCQTLKDGYRLSVSE